MFANCGEPHFSLAEGRLSNNEVPSGYFLSGVPWDIRDVENVSYISCPTG